MKSENNKTIKPLNATVLKLGLVSFFADISSEMLYPITPIFLTTVLGASMFSVGLIEGIAEATASFLKGYAGYWSDKLEKRLPFIWIGYLLSALAKPLTGISTAWTHVLVARGLDRTGKGLRSAPRDALLSESVAKENRGAAFGWHRLMDTLGAALGPLIAIGFLSLNPDQMRTLYYWAVLPGLASVFIVFSVRQPKKAIATPVVKPRFRLSDCGRNFKIYLAAWAAFSIANSSDVFLILKAKQMGVPLTTTIFMYCAYNLVYALSSPSLGKLSDQLGRKKLLISGLLVFSMVYLGFSVANREAHFWILFMAYGLYMGATDGVGKAYAVDLIDPDHKATGLGILGTVTGLSTVIASATAGLLWDHFGSSAPFYFGALGAACAVLTLNLVGNEPR